MSHSDAGKLYQLSQATSRQIQSAQIISSFDCLVASLVLSSIASSATNVTVYLDTSNRLDLSVVDNGAAIRPDVWPGICTQPIGGHSRSSVLHAASTISNLTLTSSSLTIHRRKSVHFAERIKDIRLDAPPSRLHPYRGGVIVDIRQLFVKIPVRRRAALQLSEAQRRDAVRRRIVAIALSNPSVSIRILLPNKQILFQSRQGSSLTPDTLSKTLVLRSKPKWHPIEARHESNNELHLSGYIATNALGRKSDDAQIVAVNGVPLERSAQVHSLIQKAVRQSLRINHKNSPAHSYPHAAYVLNVTCSRADVSISSYEFGALIVGYYKIDIERFIAEHVTKTLEKNSPAPTQPDKKNDEKLKQQNLLKTELEEFRIKMSDKARKRCLPTHDSEYPVPSSNTRKRRRICRPSTPNTAAPPARRPLSASELKSNCNIDENARPLSSNSQISRPKSASAILSGVAKTVPNWSNPCYRFLGRNPRSIIASRNGRKKPFSNNIERMNMNEVRVERDKLSRMRVVGQVDSKFIILVDDEGIMYGLDQHAASERAHFERLLRDVKQRIMSVKFKRGTMKVPLSSAQYSAVARFKDIIERWGWSFEISENVKSNSMLVKEVPMVKGTNVQLDSPNQLIQFIDSLSDGASGLCTPAPLVHALATRACHTAIRFGDKLTNEQCWSLVDGLIRCETPFQCAHGRPSIVPLAILKRRKQQSRKIRLHHREITITGRNEDEEETHCKTATKVLEC